MAAHLFGSTETVYVRGDNSPAPTQQYPPTELGPAEILVTAVFLARVVTLGMGMMGTEGVGTHRIHLTHLMDQEEIGTRKYQGVMDLRVVPVLLMGSMVEMTQTQMRMTMMRNSDAG